MTPIIFHIDVNSAYLSWTAAEQLKNGAEVDIRTIPAIIGGDQKSRHGIVLAKSIPAKRFGIRTGEPVANALFKCSNLLLVPPDHHLYHERSRELMAYLQEFTPDIEQVSVDECYMDFTGIAHRFPSPVDGALQIKDGVRERFGFTVNIGISSVKLLAKMASDFEKPDKVHTLFPEEIKEKMWPLPMSELFMAGRSSVETLKKLEINTIGDLAKADPRIVELHLKSHGRMLWEFANGIDRSKVQVDSGEAKGIGNSTTLREDVTERAGACEVLGRLAESVGRRLRAAGQKANMVSVEVKYHTFQGVSHQRQLKKASNADAVLYREACGLFDELWDGEPIRLLGIRTSKLEEADAPEQLSLFDLVEEKPLDERQKKMSLAMDELRERFGESALRRGVPSSEKHID
ncbi:Y-family DNA polymerase [Hespellia stercorisuis]|nr:DNA polymerase IV [Hespellia stercorisuis]